MRGREKRRNRERVKGARERESEGKGGRGKEKVRGGEKCSGVWVGGCVHVGVRARVSVCVMCASEGTRVCVLVVVCVHV